MVENVFQLDIGYSAITVEIEERLEEIRNFGVLLKSSRCSPQPEGPRVRESAALFSLIVTDRQTSHCQFGHPPLFTFFQIGVAKATGIHVRTN